MLPELNIPRRDTTSISVFRGLNRSPNTGFSRVSSSSSSIYTEFKDFKNMTSDKYPQLAPRANRSRITSDDKIKIISNLLSANSGLIYIDSDKNLHIGAAVTKIDEIDAAKQHHIVLYGNKVVVFPEKLSVNMSDKKVTMIDCQNKDLSTQVGEKSNQQIDPSTYDYAYMACSITRSYYDASANKNYRPSVTLYTNYDLTNEKYQLKDNNEMVDVFGSYANTIGNVFESYNSFYTVIGKSKKSDTYKHNRLITFKKLSYKFNYTTIRAKGIGTNIQAGDFVKISGLTDSLVCADAESYADKTYIDNLNGKTFKVYYVTENELVIKCELESSVPYTGTVTVERISPDFDEGKIVEMQNRLWCCSSENNEIYCCKQGDERNWQAYSDGISTDSWAMTCGKEGKFTGIATRGDSVIFFKENYALKIYGTKPSNFTLGEYNVPGVEIGSEKSLVNINSTLFYLGHNGVYAYQSGSLPALISEESLWGHTYKNAVGGRHENKYYISAERDDGEQELLVYDTDKGLWHKEDDTKMIDCTTYNGVLYWLDERKENIMCPDKADNLLIDNTKYEYQQEDCFEWSAETGDLYDSEFNVKNIGKIRIGIKAEKGAKVSLFVQYKDNGEWRKVSEMLYSEKKPRVFAVALRRAEYLRLKLVGTGQVEIYGIDMEHSRGSDKRGNF
nr:hypothetical protein [Ruminococcus bromii]